MRRSIPFSFIPKSYSDTSSFLRHMRNDSEYLFIKRGESRALRLFHAMAKRVPAYKDFLQKNKIRHEKINTIKALKEVPYIDKDTYLRAYPLGALCWEGSFAQKQWVVSATSGSTGEPFYFPREHGHDLQYALLAEAYLRVNFEIHKRSTLYINGFPMGVWIGGVFTHKVIHTIAERGKYPLTIISPGVNKEEIIKVIKKLGGMFDQVIIGSYGPFLKDILDDGEHAGICWRDYNIGFIFSAEGFTEGFRDYVAKKAGISNVMLNTLNHYGTVDLGTMSYETPISIYIRRETSKKKRLHDSIFGTGVRVPTLTQYVPELFYFENIDGSLYCSANSGIPLMRYDLKDNGGVLSYENVQAICKRDGIELVNEARNVGIYNTLWRLPFVYVYERSDFSVSFYAFQIYPETIRRALESRNIRTSLTGKFTVMVKFDNGQNQYLEIHLELKKNKKKSRNLSEQVQKSITRQLLKESSEYRETYKEKKSRIHPRLEWWPYGDPTHFASGKKQKWVK
jgi:phenylacetate-CoA ligase